MEKIKKQIKKLSENLSLDEKVNFINELRETIHEISPFKNEPVDLVRWVKMDNVIANDYNPNKVAPPEMELLEVSISIIIFWLFITILCFLYQSLLVLILLLVPQNSNFLYFVLILTPIH